MNEYYIELLEGKNYSYVEVTPPVDVIERNRIFELLGPEMMAALEEHALDGGLLEHISPFGDSDQELSHSLLSIDNGLLDRLPVRLEDIARGIGSVLEKNGRLIGHVDSEAEIKILPHIEPSISEAA